MPNAFPLRLPLTWNALKLSNFFSLNIFHIKSVEKEIANKQKREKWERKIFHKIADEAFPLEQQQI